MSESKAPAQSDSHELRVVVPDDVWQALQDRSRMSGRGIDEIVRASLRETLDIDNDMVYQVSTSSAIVEGLYEGCVTVADLRMHGDVGLGTFEGLDGELVMLDGQCYQARGDGSVTVAPDSAMIPYATVVHFGVDEVAVLPHVESLQDFTAQMDVLRTSQNRIICFVATGRFSHLRVRTACRTQEGVGLVEATASQVLFDFTDITGTLVGFWCPEFITTISIAGYHLHFVSDDRLHGGHVLDLACDELRVAIDDLNEVHVAMPNSAQFLAADLSGDHREDLDIAERGQHGQQGRVSPAAGPDAS